LAAAAALTMAVPLARGAAEEAVTPPEHRRGAEQTFLTFPEWFLVHSPAEYAAFVAAHPPSAFPFFGHVGQFWSSYKAVYDATRRDYPVNVGYHVMVSVIGVSTTVEYALRSAHESVVGRLTELDGGYGRTEEDRLGAWVAQDYVDFIRVRPWYEYDFADRLARVWRTPLLGRHMVRKWERKYALTTEYAAKALYGWLIMKATKAAYEDVRPVTAVWVDRLPEGARAVLPELAVLARLPDGSALVTVPRYAAFKHHAGVLAAHGATFREIAGNRGGILVSALVAAGWTPPSADTAVVFTQPILTVPARQRSVLLVPVRALAPLLNELRQRGHEVEHVYDY
jgi:hypothetical protein